MRICPVCPGLTFHGLRHSHKTWLIAGGAPEIAQARRLGHHLPNRVVETYSHVAPEVETRLLADLQRRWHKATRSPYPKRPQPKKPATKTRRPVPPSITKRQRPIPAAPITIGKRDNTRTFQRDNQKQAAPPPTNWSSTPQKHPSRDKPIRLETITQDQPQTQRNPSDQPKQHDRKGLVKEWTLGELTRTQKARSVHWNSSARSSPPRHRRTNSSHTGPTPACSATRPRPDSAVDRRLPVRLDGVRAVHRVRDRAPHRQRHPASPRRTHETPRSD